MPGPLVSCVMPTRDRLPFAAQAARYFLRQDYPHRELVVVDTGQTPVQLPADPRIRVVRPASRSITLGAARNAGVAAARGELIAHWDDDDWIGPHRLSLQVDSLEHSRVAACGLRTLLYYRPVKGDAWRYRPLRTDAPFLAGGTLCYRRSAWEAQPFPDIDVGEDGAFVAGLSEEQLVAVDDDSWYVGVIHPANTSPKNLVDPRWSPGSMSDVTTRFGSDRSFYADVRAGRATVAPAPAPRSGSATPVTLAGDFVVYDGLGSMAEYAALGLLRVGVDVRLAPIQLDRVGLTPEVLTALDRPTADGPLLYWTWPRMELETHLARRQEVFARTAWESSCLPRSWLPALQRCRALIVPSHFVADACRASGVTVPIVVVPDGVDPAVYHYRRRSERPGVTTLVVATLIPRKRLGAAVAAWQQAFGDDPDARLLVKARFQAGALAVADPRVRVIDSEERTRGIAHWYQQADVLLALGNEGFGLPVVEAMASGLPVVVLDAEGQHDVVRDAPGLVLAVPPAGVEPYDRHGFGGVCGNAAVPDTGAAAAHLRWVADHPEEARELGRAASRWAVRHRNLWGMGPAALAAMEVHADPPRPLHRRRAIWVSSWKRRCGISEYTAALTRPLGNQVVVTATRPDPSRVRLLHLQHEDALVDDASFAGYLDALDCPVVVTEHSVRVAARPWDGRVDAVVALTDEGVNRLRNRCPGTRVVRLHHGCPTWFPPRKPRRSRVLGSFGFLAPHKGFYSLVGAMRSLPGTELVLCSHAHAPEPAAELKAAADGIPLRWYRDYLPAREAASRLAAECDALVFWYDEVPVAAASLAVRVGLATGVPVLTSPTNWFADLTDVTYQPSHLGPGISRILDDDDLRAALVAGARDYCNQHAWKRVAQDHLALWESIEA